MGKFSRFLALLAGLVLATPALANDNGGYDGYHLSQRDGNDLNDGFTPATAVKTLSVALAKLCPGDTLYIANGTYTQQFRSGTCSGSAPTATTRYTIVGNITTPDSVYFSYNASAHLWYESYTTIKGIRFTAEFTLSTPIDYANRDSILSCSFDGGVTAYRVWNCVFDDLRVGYRVPIARFIVGTDGYNTKITNNTMYLRSNYSGGLSSPAFAIYPYDATYTHRGYTISGNKITVVSTASSCSGSHTGVRIEALRAGTFSDNSYTYIDSTTGNCKTFNKNGVRFGTDSCTFTRDSMLITAGAVAKIQVNYAYGAYTGQNNTFTSCLFRNLGVPQRSGSPGMWVDDASGSLFSRNHFLLSDSSVVGVKVYRVNSAGATFDHNNFFGTKASILLHFDPFINDPLGPVTLSNNIFYVPNAGPAGYSVLTGFTRIPSSADLTLKYNLYANWLSNEDRIVRDVPCTGGSGSYSCTTRFRGIPWNNTYDASSLWGSPLWADSTLSGYNPALDSLSAAANAGEFGSDIGAVETVADETRPAAITTLQASSTDPTQILLTWVSTGDDSLTGTATSYVIRTSSGVITDANFNTADLLPNLPAPAVAGTVQSHTITGLTANTNYYFAMKVYDGESYSALSNVVGIRTPSSGTGTQSVD